MHCNMLAITFNAHIHMPYMRLRKQLIIQMDRINEFRKWQKVVETPEQTETNVSETTAF